MISKQTIADLKSSMLRTSKRTSPLKITKTESVDSRKTTALDSLKSKTSRSNVINLKSKIWNSKRPNAKQIT